MRKGTEGDEETIEDRALVEEAIAEYFKEIYKRPEHLRAIQEEDEEMKEEAEDTMQIDSSSGTFKLPDIMDAIKRSNFNKGLGPDCFDGNIL